MSWATDAVLVGAAYLLGAVSFSYLIVKVWTGRDVRQVGSGNAGATNVMRAAGKPAGALALLLDVGKGVVAVFVARGLGAAPSVVAFVAAAVVIGHVYPVFLGFRGGKGVATAAGALGALAPLPALLAAGLFLIVVVWRRYVSLGSIVAVTSFPLFIFLTSRWGWTEPQNGAFVASATLVPALVVFKHRANIRRLLAGTERRLGEPRRGAQEKETPA